MANEHVTKGPDEQPAAAGADPLVGRVVAERYRVVRLLDEGGMGAVYEAEHVLMKRPVALKVLHGHLKMRGAAVQRFIREAQAASAIGHEHIVQVLDMGRMEDGAFYMALEYLEGRSLQDEIEAVGAMPLGRAARILRQVCEAVGAAHAQGIVHRDLKPDNVFLVERPGGEDFVKVLDFGIAKVAGGPESMRLTSTHAVMGTPFYMAPEQARRSGAVDHRADIYSLGVILYELLSGRTPFEADSLPELFVLIATQNPPPVATLRSDLPPPVVELVTRMLAKDPEARPQSCEEVVRLLAPWTGDDGSQAIGAARLDGEVRPSMGEVAPGPDTLGALERSTARSGAEDTFVAAGRTGRWTWAAVAVGTLALLGGGAWWASRPAEEARAASAPEAQPAARTGRAARAAGRAGPASLDRPPDSRMVTLHVETVPPGAELLFDDVLLGTSPYEGRLPVDEGEHWLTARKDGYQETRRPVQVDEAGRVRLEVVLQRAKAEGASRAGQGARRSDGAGTARSVDGPRAAREEGERAATGRRPAARDEAGRTTGGPPAATKRPARDDGFVDLEQELLGGGR